MGGLPATLLKGVMVNKSMWSYEQIKQYKIKSNWIKNLKKKESGGRKCHFYGFFLLLYRCHLSNILTATLLQSAQITTQIKIKVSLELN